VLRRLTHKQKTFCKYYVANGFNATQAALKAGYKKTTAYSIGSENLKKPEIKKEIDKLQRKVEEKMEMTFEWKLEKLKKAIEAGLIDAEHGVEIKNASLFLGAMSESNKMQGHYAAEKKTSETDIKEAVDLLTELIEANKRDF
jgi:phage terminase small subunit